MHTKFRNSHKIYKCTQDSEMYKKRFSFAFLLVVCELHLYLDFDLAPHTNTFFYQGMSFYQSDIPLVSANHQNAPPVADDLLISQSHKPVHIQVLLKILAYCDKVHYFP
ncbi:hypothetical protein GOODEAATRI_032195 [Goodea atripinnis]|uniref:Maturase K n=1 Tax=Goodea atripinnis TaxID=208336 RepID=A0ABV0PIT4_9TELE